MLSNEASRGEVVERCCLALTEVQAQAFAYWRSEHLDGDGTLTRRGLVRWLRRQGLPSLPTVGG